jgi:2-oxo-4-hydroxy-4-carboxy-5-ureidoimidazoline decarboxylase
MDMSTLNALAPEEFVRLIGPVFDHSPWIAAAAAGRRPFPTVEILWGAMCDVVRQALPVQQLALICAHPDLVGRSALTAASQGEQAAAGLMGLSPAVAALFTRYNADYKDRFGFPFVICARLNKKDAILAAFPLRLQNTTSRERATALEEIFKIARLRLDDLITQP